MVLRRRSQALSGPVGPHRDATQDPGCGRDVDATEIESGFPDPDVTFSCSSPSPTATFRHREKS